MSKFSSVFQSKQASAASPETTEEKMIDATPPVEAAAETVAPVQGVQKVEETPVVKPESKPINMEPPRGKKGHPDYNQVTIYLKKQTQNEAKIALLQARDERDFSELVEDLIANWLKQKQ